ncbi:CLUMA_CG019093, isoform B [Clunio marinus]|uniref:CLUMA_CG019093, isoform B n=1 Tax=Clunio marinus TaxID=568069 RepID=A0A1J1J1H4_9DIPT|nr:CLUMA_CG019093, isoform B [Clunio marinus]
MKSLLHLLLMHRLTSSSVHETCHSSKSRHHFDHEYLSELESLRDDVQVPSRSHHQSHDQIRKVQNSFTIVITRRQVSPAVMSLTSPKNLCSLY